MVKNLCQLKVTAREWSQTITILTLVAQLRVKSHLTCVIVFGCAPSYNSTFRSASRQRSHHSELLRTHGHKIEERVRSVGIGLAEYPYFGPSESLSYSKEHSTLFL